MPQTPALQGNLQSFLLAVGIGSLLVGGAAGTLLTLAFTGTPGYAVFNWGSGSRLVVTALLPLRKEPELADALRLYCNAQLQVSRTASAARAPEVARQSEKIDKIVDSLKELTLLEASELVKAIEETFGVDASASAGAVTDSADGLKALQVVMAAPGAGGGDGGEDAAPEKTDFDVVIKEVPKEKKIAIIKAGGEVERRQVVEAKPKDFCEDAKKQLEEAGAVVEVV
ncbi:50S ribosomal protein L12, chloroplastic [Symbiodinium microadriaticum]|uniref:50S ribosomal protein L12, chloroplastic n=1 Tax=Symbiodinium microadriaticum TaxID=2951 RepID=A0A1Q9DAF5_SYMMI|nr:50S ribosomal protein L12, chloroplastic [Symbiodinium microadriaticum]